MDDFRKLQKRECNDGSKKQAGKYGCACCRRIANLNVFKKVTRRRARHVLKQLDGRAVTVSVG